MRSSRPQPARFLLLAALAASLTVSPIHALGGAGADQLICIATMKTACAADCCEPEPVPAPCCAKHDPHHEDAPTKPGNCSDPDGAPAHCPGCVHAVPAPCALPSTLDASLPSTELLIDTHPLVHLCHAASWVFRDFHPPSL